jgi:hypothetical protein
MTRKWHPTPAIDGAIRDAWTHHLGVKAYRVVQIRTGCEWPKWAINRRAQKLGCSRRVKEMRWTPEEVAYLEKYAHLSDIVLARKITKRFGIHRTPTAFHLKKKRLLIRANVGYFTATAAGVLLGVDAKKITRLIREGKIKAQQRGTERKEIQGGDMWAILDGDLRKFIWEHPSEIDLGNVEKVSFLELLRDGSRGARLA